MEVTLSKNITVVYDGPWLTRGHASHIGVGCVIEFYTGLVLDCAVLSNFCLGCSLGPKETDPKYNEWKRTHQCQTKTQTLPLGAWKLWQHFCSLAARWKKMASTTPPSFVMATGVRTWRCAMKKFMAYSAHKGRLYQPC
ncbi:hypothetical protein HPB48_026913 [Haemaphysalis longicornis]|uniref:Mutator-like transposase domain-containing protein n=1 Tax=Haemaphysalis longicornis TaxID=44386 RepID=A0A9J6HAW6_HAELO|nr:hypothetical protein HPB48_026913 [Haemaphysalis longicornis]